MDSKKYLLEQIKKCKQKMNLAKLVDFGILYTALGGIFGILCEILSLFVPFYYANLAAVLCFAAGLLIGIGYAVYRRADMKQAAGRLDSFGLKERMLTAYENVDAEDEFAGLQRQDALRHYNRMREQIKIPLRPDRRHVLALFAAVFAAAGISLIPSSVREQAKIYHKVQEEAEKEQEALEELLEALEGVDMESLTEEQRAKLQELLDTMELSQEELGMADSRESLSGASQKLEYKYEQAAKSLELLASQMEDPEAAGVAGAEAFAKAAANRSGQQVVEGGTPTGSAGNEEGNDSGGGEGGENGSGDGNGQDGENGSGNGNGQGSGNSSGNGNGQDGGNSAGNGQSGKNGSGNGNGQGGENGSGNGNGQGSGNGSGNGNGQGGENGSGNGNGQNAGNGAGNGNGTGNGRGTGSSNTAHDYVSIPNETADDSSLTGNKTGSQNSDFYREQNGLAWEGDHVDYNSVIGEYTDSAYEGIANGKYPSGMESVIRDYFENLNK